MVKFSVLLLLIVAVGVVVWLAIRAHEWSRFKISLRSGALVVGAGALTVWSAPENWWGVIWVLTAIVLGVATIAIEIEWPDTNWGDWVHDRVWGKLSDPDDPNSGPVVPPALVTQCAALAVFLVGGVTFFLMSITPGPHHDAAVTPSKTPAASAPVSPKATPSTAPTVSPSALSTVGSAVSGCGVTLAKIADKDRIDTTFRSPTGIDVCTNSGWGAWTGNYPASFRATWTWQDTRYAYCLFDWNGKTYLIKYDTSLG